MPPEESFLVSELPLTVLATRKMSPKYDEMDSLHSGSRLLPQCSNGCFASLLRCSPLHRKFTGFRNQGKLFEISRCETELLHPLIYHISLARIVRVIRDSCLSPFPSLVLLFSDKLAISHVNIFPTKHLCSYPCGQLGTKQVSTTRLCCHERTASPPVSYRL